MISINLENKIARGLLLLATLALIGTFLTIGIFRFITSVLADPRNQVDVQLLEAASGYFPDSAPLESRLAARLLMSRSDEAQSYEAYADKALYHANRAVSLAPWSYEAHLLRATALEQKGEFAEAENALNYALKLSPNRIDLHWRLANLFVRDGRIDQALNEAILATSEDPQRLPDIINLIWQASDGNLDYVRKVAGSSAVARLKLAQFLITQEKENEAADIFTGIDNQTLNQSPESGQLIDSLISKGRYEAAAKMWMRVYGISGPVQLWNGDFESMMRKGLNQFDWNIRDTRYAEIGITGKQAHNGSRSLLIVYQGIETTRLRDEVSHLIIVEPGRSYSLEAWYKTQDLNTSDGPKVTIVTADSSAKTLAETAPIESGSKDWQPLSLKFTAPPESNAVILKIEQTPRFSYSKPTHGAVMFDDFKLNNE